MVNFRPINRATPFLLPPSVEDRLPKEHLARFVVDIVDRLEDHAHGTRAGWLKYLGYVPQEDLPALFAGARGFLLPSLYEGFGLPVLEAMASGIPVLTSNSSSLAEVAQGAALLVEPEDVPAMTESIRIVLDDEGWRRAAVNRSRDVAARYSWETTIRNTVKTYRKVLAA